MSSMLSLSSLESRGEGNIYKVPQDSPNGSFVFPRAFPLVFREGSPINISWMTDFSNVNLYYYQRGNVANSIQLATNIATQWYQWEASAQEPNLTEPFVFRIVDAQGSTEDQNGGGFWSSSWYLSRNEVQYSSSGVASGSTSLSTSTSATTETERPTTTDAEPTSRTTSNVETEGTQTMGRPQSEEKTDRLSTGATIGLSVGLVIVGIAMIVFAFFFYRKRRNGSKTSTAYITSSTGQEETKPPVDYSARHEMYTTPSELQGAPLIFELPGNKHSLQVH